MGRVLSVTDTTPQSTAVAPQYPTSTLVTCEVMVGVATKTTKRAAAVSQPAAAR